MTATIKVALVGFDADSNQTMIAICPLEDIKKAAQSIYETCPQTELVGQYELNDELMSQVLDFKRRDV